MRAKVMPLRDPARTLAAVSVRRARAATGLSQEGLAQRLGSSDRAVRRRESGRCDLGVLELALRYPEFAAALGRELVAAAERLGAEPSNDVTEAA